MVQIPWSVSSLNNSFFYMKSIIFFASILLASCNSQSTQDKTEAINMDSDSVAENNAPAPLVVPGCYAYILKKDSAFIKLDVSGNTVSGDLSYNLYEKDTNKGTINGHLQDSLIIADYTFQAEGMTSVRQVVFKIHGDSLTEGFGDIEMKGDTARFKNISQLEFQDQRPFIKTNCK